MFLEKRYQVLNGLRLDGWRRWRNCWFVRRERESRKESSTTGRRVGRDGIRLSSGWRSIRGLDVGYIHWSRNGWQLEKLKGMKLELMEVRRWKYCGYEKWTECIYGDSGASLEETVIVRERKLRTDKDRGIWNVRRVFSRKILMWPCNW